MGGHRADACLLLELEVALLGLQIILGAACALSNIACVRGSCSLCSCTLCESKTCTPHQGNACGHWSANSKANPSAGKASQPLAATSQRIQVCHLQEQGLMSLHANRDSAMLAAGAPSGNKGGSTQVPSL